MGPTATDDDVGKVVENDNGTSVGRVVAVDDDHLFVEPEPGVVDSIKAALGSGNDSGETMSISQHAVREITDDAVRLEAEFRSDDGTDAVIDRGEGDDQRNGDADEMEPTGAKADDDGSERQSKMEDAPPEGDRTVTKGRGKREDR